MDDATPVVFPDGFADALDSAASMFGMLRSMDNTTRAHVCHELADCVRAGTEVPDELTSDGPWVLAETAELLARTDPSSPARTAALAWARMLCDGVLVAPTWVMRVHGTGEPAHTPPL